MNRHILASAAIITSISIGLPAIAEAAAEVTVADASFASTDTTGCISTEAFVLARGGDLVTANSASNAYLRVSQVDDCNEKQLLDTYGEIPLTSKDMVFDKSLKSVALDLNNLQLKDTASGRTLSVNVYVQWLGHKKEVSTRKKDYMVKPGKFTRINRVATQRYRSAMASGTITVDSQSLLLGETENASLSIIK